MADGAALSIAVFGVSLGIIGYRRSSVLSLAIIGSTSALIAAGWLSYRAFGAPIAVQAPENWRAADSLQVTWPQAILVFMNAGLILIALAIERSKPATDGFSRWRFVPAVAVNLCAIASDARFSAAAFFAVCSATAAAPPSALVVRPPFAFLGGALVAYSTLFAASGGSIPSNWLRLNVVHLSLAGMAMGFAATLFAIVCRVETLRRPERFYSASAPLLAIAGVCLHLNATTFVNTPRSQAILAAAVAAGALANFVWSIRTLKQRSGHSEVNVLRPIRSLVQAESALEIGLQAASMRLGASMRMNRESKPFNLVFFLVLAAAAGFAAVAISRRLAGVGS